RCFGSSALEVVQRLSVPTGILSYGRQQAESGCKRCFRLTRSIAYMLIFLVPLRQILGELDSSSRAKGWFHSLTFLWSPTLSATVWSILSGRSCLAVRVSLKKKLTNGQKICGSWLNRRSTSSVSISFCIW